MFDLIQVAVFECSHNDLYLSLRYEAPVGRPILIYSALNYVFDYRLIGML